MVYSVAWGKLIHEKNLKISCQTPFKDTNSEKVWKLCEKRRVLLSRSESRDLFSPCGHHRLGHSSAHVGTIFFGPWHFRQRVVKVYFPPTPDVSRQTQRLQYSAKQHATTRVSSSWWFIYSRNQVSTRSTKPRWTRGEPAREHNNIILLAIYNVHDAIYRSTEYTQFTFLFFALLSFEPTEYLLNLLIYLPEIGAIATSGIYLPENPPFSPLRFPKQDPARPPPPSNSG
jgi:hypothetical protein